jgi:hypothetical protein
MDRCRYPSKPCLNARAVKLNGELHRFCEQHRRQANQNQMRWSKRKQTVVRGRRGDGEEGDGEYDEDEDAAHRGSNGDPSLASSSADGHGYAPAGGRHGLHLPHPPPPGAAHNGMGMPHPHSMHANVNVNAAGTSLSHLSLANGHPHHSNNPNNGGGLISSFQDHMARGGAIPGTNGVNLVLSGGAVRRELAPASGQTGQSSHRAGGHVPPIQTSLPPLLPPRAAVEQPDPSAVHALLMLEHAASIVSSGPSSSSQVTKQEPVAEEDDDAQVRRELKRAKSNEWVARPTLSPAGLPTVASLATHGMPSSTSSSSAIASVASIGRSASWQPPPVVREDPRESLGQWMQRKQASLPSLTNITRIEKRPYDSISSSAPSGSSSNSNNFLHRGPENNSTTTPQHRGAYHVPLHPTSATKSSSSSSSDPAADGTKRSALV